jgi:phage virion morphogenesis protein
MAGARITLTLDDAALVRQLGDLIGALTNPEPALRSIGEELQRATQERFDPGQKRAPDGTPWARNSPVTIARKGRDNPLYERGNLQNTIRYQVLGTRGVEVGTNLVYGAAHQFGMVKGYAGRTRRGAPIPWGNIPARPYLGLSADDETEVVRILRDYLERQTG